MTNPDREELVKLADRLAALPTFRMEIVTTVPGVALNAAERDLIVTALRRLASSDSGVKGEPVRWEWLHPHPIDGTDIWRPEQYWNGYTSKTSRPLYTAPHQADAGMREALEEARERLLNIWAGRCPGVGRENDPVAFRDWATAYADVGVKSLDRALTAPGATTKSDGGVCAGGVNPGWDEYPECGATSDEECRFAKSDVEVLAATTAERPGTVTSKPEPSTSDPSSTRSDVTALADAMWQLLDDMGEKGQSVCLAAKAQARVAYEPFRDKSEGEYADWMSLSEADRILGECNRVERALLTEYRVEGRE